MSLWLPLGLLLAGYIVATVLVEKQQQTLSLSLDDTGVLVRKANKRDSAGEVKKTNASTETSKSYEQEFISKDSNHQYISITA